MRFASIAEMKDRFSECLTQLHLAGVPIVVTKHGRPYALTQPLSGEDREELAWRELAKRRLDQAWEDEDDALYDYL